MKKDDIIRMAQEAGELKCDCCLPYYEETDIEGFEGFLEHFAALVAAAEREACAKLIEDYLSVGLAKEMARIIRDH